MPLKSNPCLFEHFIRAGLDTILNMETFGIDSVQQKCQLDAEKWLHMPKERNASDKSVRNRTLTHSAGTMKIEVEKCHKLHQFP